MNTDPQTPKTKYNLRKRKNKKYHKDSDSDTDSDSDYIPGVSDEDEEPEFALREWQNFLGKLFPSKYSNRRNTLLHAMDKLKAAGKQNIIYEEKDNVDHGEGKIDEEMTDEETQESDEPHEIEYFADEEDFLDNPNMKVNIIFTIAENIDDDQYEDELEEQIQDEDEQEECMKREEGRGTSNATLIFEKGDNVEVKLDKWKEWKKGTVIKRKEDKYHINVQKVKYKNISQEKVRAVKATLDDNEDLLKKLTALLEVKKIKGEDAMTKKLEQMMALQEKEISKKKKKEEKKAKLDNSKTFKKLLQSRNVMCDFKYFRNLSTSQQKKILEQMREIKNHSQLSKPYRITLLESPIPAKHKAIAFNKINTLSYMDPSVGEYYKIKQWVDTFMKIPFGKYNSLPLTMNDGQEKCQSFMENARQTLDNSVYGLDDAKMQIMQMVGQWISNPQSVGTAIAIHGPMGTGKTTLIREGISKILNRPFTFIALGGATDSSFLEGHSYTYEGSNWGKIVDILIQSKCMNPVIYFDELDKVSMTPKGEEIIGILTHLTDTTQNVQFHDKYFSSLDFDLSKALFIFSYNDEDKINPILRDRMYRIETKGYDKKDKIIIATKYLIPVIEKNINFEEKQILLPEDTLNYIIDTFTTKEKGVRNLKRCLEIIYSKLNLFRLMKPDSKLFDTKMNSLNVTFPFTVKREIVDKLITKKETDIPYDLYL